MREFLSELARTLLLDVPFNTSLVLRSVAVLGAACGAVGVFLLLRKRSLVADALAHAALPGVAAGFLIAVAFGQDARSLMILLPSAAIAGAIGVACMYALSTMPRIREDASIGIVLSVFFAVGVVLLGVIQNLPVSQKAGLHQFIFGQAATMSAGDSRLILGVALAVLIALALCYKELRLLCFDASFANGLGFPRILLDGLLMALITIVTVIGLHAVGALLMVALLILPATAARFWTDRLGRMVFISALLGATGAYVGAAASAVAERVPTGPAIVVACGVVFALSMALAPRRGIAIAAIRNAVLRRRIARQHLLRAMLEAEEIRRERDAPISMEALLDRRQWSRPHLARTLARAQRHGEVIGSSAGHALTEQGRTAASRIVRTHRLWEHYLTTEADIAPHHVDRAVEDIEHVLGEEIVAELERTLRESTDALRTPRAEEPAMPESPHALDRAEGLA